MFRQAADYYISLIQNNPSKTLKGMLNATRGIHVVGVSSKEVGKTFTPKYVSKDPGCFFMSYEQLEASLVGISKDNLEIIKKPIDEYDPDISLLFLIALLNSPKTEMYVYKITFASLFSSSPL
jgi:hypothetical protein